MNHQANCEGHTGRLIGAGVQTGNLEDMAEAQISRCHPKSGCGAGGPGLDTCHHSQCVPLSSTVQCFVMQMQLSSDFHCYPRGLGRKGQENPYG